MALVRNRTVVGDFDCRTPEEKVNDGVTSPESIKIKEPKSVKGNPLKTSDSGVNKFSEKIPELKTSTKKEVVNKAFKSPIKKN